MSSEDPPPPPTQDVQRRQDIVLKKFVEGMSIPNIAKYLSRHGFKVARETPYQDISRATNEQLLSYNPPPGQDYVNRLLAKFTDSHKPLRKVYVPSYGGRMATIGAAAQACAKAIWSIAEKKALGQAVGYIDQGGKRIAPWNFPVSYPNPDGNSEPAKAPYAEVNATVEREVIEPDPMVIEIRIGVCGGYTMSLACRDLAAALAAGVEEQESDLKKFVLKRIEQETEKGVIATEIPAGIVKRRFKVKLRFVFVNLVSGFDRTPQTNPIAFLHGLLGNETLASRTKIDIFNAIPFAEVGDTDKIAATIEATPSLRTVREAALFPGFDTILTSGSSIDDPHCMFRSYYEDKEEKKPDDKRAVLVRRLIKRLEDEGVEGDFLWMPLTGTKPFILRDLWKQVRDEGDDELADLLRYQPMTLLSLRELANHVEKGRDVFFILAPCGVCNVEKSRIAKAVLNQERRIVTHLFVDKDTAAHILESP